MSPAATTGPTGAGTVRDAGGALHADCVTTLERWEAPDAEQDAVRVDYLTYLHVHPDAWSRTCRPHHVTASALVTDASAARVLLTLHARVGRWLQTGGHIEPHDATLAAAARREAVEESGIAGLRIRPEPLRLSRHPAPCLGGTGDHLDVQFLAVAPPEVRERRTAESLALGWFAHDALPADTDDAVRSLVASARDQLGPRGG